jgi:hypothetical protein
MSYLLGFDQKTLVPIRSDMTEETHRQRLAWTYCYIYDRQASIKLGKAFWSRGPGLCFQNQPGFGRSVRESARNNFPTLLTTSSKKGDDSASYVEALVEVTQIITNVHDTLYPNRDRTIAMVEIGDYAGLLDDFTRTFTEFELSWENQQFKTFPLNEMVWMSFHYSVLYAYSFGFQAHIMRAIAMIRLTRKMNKGYHRPVITAIFPRGTTGAADSKYILESIRTATQIISICVNDLCSTGAFKYLPFRFYGYMNFAAVFLIKAVFTGAIIPSNQGATLALLERLIRQLEAISTSDRGFSHPCTRGAKQLKSLIESLHAYRESSKSVGQTPYSVNDDNDEDAENKDIEELEQLLASDVDGNWGFSPSVAKDDFNNQQVLCIFLYCCYVNQSILLKGIVPLSLVL